MKKWILFQRTSPLLVSCKLVSQCQNTSKGNKTPLKKENVTKPTPDQIMHPGVHACVYRSECTCIYVSVYYSTLYCVPQKIPLLLLNDIATVK
jgi:hypothetical protein